MDRGDDAVFEASTFDDEDYGRLERSGDRLLLRFTRRLVQPPSAVWRALTEPEYLAAWFPTTIDGDRIVGAQLRLGFREGEGAPFDGEMLIFEPPLLLELRWGDEVLRFALQPDGDGCVLTFTDIFEELGKAARDGAGWHSCLDLLGHAIAGRAAPWSSAERWRQLRDAYVESFGPSASTTGPPDEWEDVHGSETDRH